MANRDKYVSSAFGSGNVDSGISRMLGQEVREVAQYCSDCGTVCKPAYKPPNSSSPDVYCKDHYETKFASRCEGCARPIMGEYLLNRGKKYHQQCAPDGGMCDRCKKPIVGEVCIGLGKNWHPKCWTCSLCNCPLGDNIIELSGAPYCHKCAQDLRQNKGEIKAAGGRTITMVHKDNSKEQQVMHEVWRNVQQGKEVCKWCRKLITGEAIPFGGGMWHPECFSCTVCADQIGQDGFVEKDGLAYCRKCNEQHNASAKPQCAGCAKAIAGLFVVAWGNKYHSECFLCANCGSSLNDGYTFKNGKPNCSKCATPAPAAPVSGPVTPARRAGFVIDPRSGKKTVQK